ncbi:MAG: gluconate 2-dehydrogenase subunit 3 family protein [Actinomycetota bacterium]
MDGVLRDPHLLRTHEAPGGYTRREFLASGARAGAAGVAAASVPIQLLGPRARAAESNVLSASERRTLRAAVARIVPAESEGDWSGADVGADAYILQLLSGVSRIYAGGPTRRRFARFQRLSRIKRMGWSRHVRQLRTTYRAGLRALDDRARGDFAGASAEAQDAILTGLDYANDEFFGLLVEHTLEGVYSHPVYGGNDAFRAWKEFSYQGDVHGVRFPGVGSADAPWNRFGGYAPEEMAKPGEGEPWLGGS